MTAVNNKVPAERIQQLVDTFEYYVNVIEGTTTTVATVLLPLPNGTKFSLATEISACVDPAEFDEEKGAAIACARATRIATDKLWDLEGYMLAHHFEPTGETK